MCQKLNASYTEELYFHMRKNKKKRSTCILTMPQPELTRKCAVNNILWLCDQIARAKSPREKKFNTHSK